MSDIREIYEKYFTDVYKYLLAVSHDSHLAEELTQETFFKALKKIDGFRGECDLRVWLCQIAKNAYYTYLRKNKRYVPPESETEAADSDAGLFEKFADEEEAYELHRILHGLAEPYKEVFSLRVFGELSYSMIAGLFGKSESWARVTYHRACIKIRESYQAGGKNEDQL